MTRPYFVLERFFQNTEGRLFLVGLAMVIGLSVEIILLSLWDTTTGRALAIGAVVEIFTGREAGIPIALTQGAPRWFVFQVSMTQDIAFALLVFPWFLLGLHHFWDRRNFIMRRVRSIEAAAQRHEKFVRRWGPLGVFLFMLVPFLVNGPLVGLIAGRLAGINTRFLLLPVVGATALASFAWTFFFDAMQRLSGSFDERWGLGIAIGVAAVVGGLALVDFIREEVRHHRDDSKE